jgi:hypothetical protein
VVCDDDNLGERHKALSDEGEISTWSAKFLLDDVISSPYYLAEICWEIYLVSGLTDISVIGDFDGSNHCGVIYILYLSKKRCATLHKWFIMLSLVLLDEEMASSIIGHAGYRPPKSST